MVSPVLKFKRGLLSDLPLLNEGEPGFTTDYYELYVGSADGNKLIGSGRYWNKETSSSGGSVKVFEATSNGTNFVGLAASTNVPSSITFTLPNTDGSSGDVLVTDGSGNLSFSPSSSSSFTISGDSGSNDTFNTGETLTFSGSSNEIITTITNNQVEIGLRDTVNITTELDVPTIEVSNIEAKDGSSSITIANSTGSVSIADSLSVSGNTILDSVTATSYSGDGTGITSVDADQLDGQEGTYYLDYNNFTNTPTIPDTSTLMPKSGGTFTGNVDLNNTVYLRLGNDKDNIIGYTGAINLFRFTDNTRISGDTMFFTTYNGVEYMRLSTTFGTQLKHQGITKLTVDSTGINVNGQLNDLTIPSGTGTIAITADIPTNNNELTNGRGYITSSSLVGYATEGYVDSAVAGVSTFSGDYGDLTNTPTIPSDTGDLTNSVGFVTSGIVVGYTTEGYVDNLVAISTFSGDYGDLTNTPTIPSDTGDLTNSVGFVTSGIVVGYTTEGYVDTQVGLATAGLALETYVDNLVAISTFSGDYNDLTNQPTIPSDTGDLTNSVGFVTSGIVVGYATEGYVDDAVSGVSTFSGDYNDLSNKPTIPSIVGLTSEGYVNNLVSISTFSGNYNDLSNKPTIPSDTGDLTNSVGFVTSSIVVGYSTEGYVNNLVAISTFSGDYNDLTNQPTIPSDTGDLTNSVGFITSGSLVGYATEGYVDSAVVGVSTFSGDYNDLSNKPTIPSDTGDLTNSVGFVTSSVVVGYATEGYVDNLVAISTFSGDYGDLTNTPTIPSDTGDLTNSVGFVTSSIVVGYATEGYVDTHFLRSDVAHTKSGITTFSDDVILQSNLNVTGLSTFAGDANFQNVSVGGTLSLSGAGSQFFAYNEDTVKVKFANWYSSNDRQYGMGQLWFETWFAAIDNNPSQSLRDERRIGFYLEQPNNGSSDSGGTNNLHPTNDRMHIDINGVFVRNNFEVTGDSTFSGNVSIAGTLTYEDVTNVDSVGLITARSGVDVTGNITVTGTVDGRDIASDGSKLDGIESGATADQTASEILTAIKTVDGAGSGLDADLLDGIQGASFLRSDAADTATGKITFSGGHEAQATFLSGAQNFDNIKTSGFFSLYNVNASGHTNAPFQYGAMISVSNTASSLGMGMQLANERLGNGLYVRGMNDSNDTWSSWAEVWTSNTDGSGSGLDADTLDGVNSGSFLRSDASDTYSSGTLTFGAGTALDLATNDVYASFRVFRNSKSGSDGLFMGYGNNNSGLTRIYGGGSTTTHLSVSSSGMTFGGNNVWHAGNDGSGSGLDADTLDGFQGSSYLRSNSTDTYSGGTLTVQSHSQSGSYQGWGLYYSSGWKHTNANSWGYYFRNQGGGLKISVAREAGTANGAATTNDYFFDSTTDESIRIDHTNSQQGYAQQHNINAPFYNTFSQTGSSYQAIIKGRSTGSGQTFIGSLGILHYTNGDHNLVLHSILSDGTGSRAYTISGSNGSIWTSGNDGSGSGLDADTVDGIQGASFLRSDAADTFSGNLTGSSGANISLNSNVGDNGTTAFSSMTGRLEFDHDFSDTARGPNKILLYSESNWISGFAVHSNTTAYYSGGDHKWYKSNSSTSFTEVASLTSSGSLSTSSQGTLFGTSNDGAGSGLDADLLDGLQAFSFLRSDADSISSGFLKAEGFVGSGGALRIANPGGASFATGTSSSTGYLKITLPVSWTNTMMRMTIKCYEYATGESFDIHCGGYNYSTNSSWINTFAYIVNDPSVNRNFNVRFGHDGSKCAIYIGESNSTWSYFQFGVTEFLAGYSNYLPGTWHNGWSCSITTTLGTITSTQSNNQVGRFIDGNTVWHAGNDGSGSGLDADTVDGIQGASFLRSDASTTYDGTTSGRVLRFSCVSGRTANSTSGNLFPLEVYQGTVNTDAAIAFHIGNDYAAYFGLDGTTNDLFWGGWSRGAAKYKIWHAANDGSGSGLDADTIDGTQLSNLMTLSGTQTITGDKDFDGTLTYDLINGPGSQTRDKIRVWTSGTYSIGMKSGFSYGGLGNTGTEYAMTFQMSNTTYRGWWWGDNAHTDAQGAMALTTEGRATIAHSLRIGYGESDSVVPGATHRLDVSGSILATSNITAYSDINLKKNIEVIPNALDKVSQIRGVTFDRIDLEDESRQSGVIAQEVEKVLPEVVRTAQDGTKTVAYGNLVGLLIESIKELKAEVEALKTDRN